MSNDFYGILTDKQIKAMCVDKDNIALENPLVYPFSESKNELSDGTRCISYGLTHAGYDIRLGSTFYTADEKTNFILKTTCPSDDFLTGEDMFGLVQRSEERIVLKPKQFCLAHSVEEFNIPNNVLGLCVGKSTPSRMGILVVVTPLEPGWKGYLTLEIYNMSSSPIELVSGTGITQIQFHKTIPSEVSYDSKGGKYQNQENLPVLPMLKY
jgi:dCTP deaminase